MVDTLTGVCRLTIGATHTKDLDLADPVSRLSQTWERMFASGSGDGQINKIFHDTRSLAGAADEELDLAGGLTDQFGAVLTFTKVKVLAIRNNADSALSVGGAAANGFSAWAADPTDVVKLAPAGAQGSTFVLLICDPAGVAVTAGTGDLLKVALAAGTGGTYDIIILGV